MSRQLSMAGVWVTALCVGVAGHLAAPVVVAQGVSRPELTVAQQVPPTNPTMQSARGPDEVGSWSLLPAASEPLRRTTGKD